MPASTPNHLALMHDGHTVRAFTYVGSYTVAHYNCEGDHICADCLNSELWLRSEVTMHGVYWEGAPLICCECNGETESAYGCEHIAPNTYHLPEVS